MQLVLEQVRTAKTYDNRTDITNFDITVKNIKGGIKNARKDIKQKSTKYKTIYS